METTYNEKVDTVYIICTTRHIAGNNSFQYIPIVDVREDMKSFTIAASSDLIGAQMKFMDFITTFGLSGVPTIVIPVTIDKYREIFNEVESNIVQAANAYVDIIKCYESIYNMFNEKDTHEDLKFHLYSAIVGQRPPCILDKDLEIVKSAELDIFRGLTEAAMETSDECDLMITNTIEYLSSPDIGDNGPPVS